MTPCDSAAATFHVPSKPTAALADELLALADADALEAALEAEAEAEPLELAAEDEPDPPQATRERHASARHAAAAIATILVR